MCMNVNNDLFRLEEVFCKRTADKKDFLRFLSSVNEPPTFHQPEIDLKTFAGENFVFQFAASDPEGSALLFQMEEGPKGTMLSPAGLLIWRVPREEEEEGRQASRSFRFTLSDECNAQSTFTVEVVTKPSDTFIENRTCISCFFL